MEAINKEQKSNENVALYHHWVVRRRKGKSVS